MSTSEADLSSPAKDANRIKPLLTGVGVLLAVTVLVASLLFKSYSIPSSAMEPTLRPGDQVIVQTHIAPQRGDILVFKYPGLRVDYVMRLIGLPGERVQMSGGRLLINGVLAPRVAEGFGPSTVCPDGSQSLRYRELALPRRAYVTYDCGVGGRLDNTAAVIVPPGHYFFMGDNRDNSLDSRGDLGVVPEGNIVGKVQLIVSLREE